MAFYSLGCESVDEEARKRAEKEYNKKHDNRLLELLKSSRTLVLFNTGTRKHKSKKDYNRKWHNVEGE